MDKHLLVEQYLSSVCREVKARELHKEIRQEMADHLDDLIALKRSEGSDEEEAVQWAVAQMGDPETVGAGLNQVHKPKMAWGLIGGLALLLVISLVAMYAVELSYAAMKDSIYNQFPARFLQKQAVFAGIGLVLTAVFFFVDYRRLQSYSWALYTGAILLMLGTAGFGHTINGMRAYFAIGGLSINWIAISPYALILAAAGILLQMDNSQRSAWQQQLLLVAVPASLFIYSRSFSSLFIYGFGYLVLFAVSRRSWRELVPSMLAAGVLTGWYLSSLHYITMRLAAFFDRHSDPLGAGYMYIQIDHAVRTAGWWGHGLASVTTRLPMIHTDTVFTYLIYSLGWVAGGIVLLGAVLLIHQMVHVFVEVRDPYGKLLVSGLAALFAVQFIWSLGMSLGLLPLLGIGVPFISYGGSQIVIQLAALGLILGVYRRKDMIRVRSKA